MTKLQLTMRTVLSGFMVLIGIAHFTHGPTFASIMPPFPPYPLLLVYVSGAIEIALGLMLSIDRTQRLASWLLIALIITWAWLYTKVAEANPGRRQTAQ